MFLADYHTHTKYSHGTGTVLDNATVARDKGLREIAITDHSFSHIAYGVKRRHLPCIRRDCDMATEVTGVKVLMGIEANITSRGTDLRDEDLELFDIILAGYHKFSLPGGIGDFFGLTIPAALDTVFKIKPSIRADKRLTRAVVKAIETTPIDILTHIGYGIHVDVGEVVRVCSATGTLIELNGKRICLTREEFECILASDVGLVVNSDAHSPDRVGDFTRGIDFLSEYSQDVLDRVVNHDAIIDNFRYRGRRL